MIAQGANIKFIGVARASDRAVVASWTAESGSSFDVAMREVLNAPDFMMKIIPGARYTLVGELNAFNFTMDEEKRVYVVIASIEYPERLCFRLIADLMNDFRLSFGAASLTCPRGALDTKARSIFKQLIEKYEDPTKSDNLSKVLSDVKNVTNLMTTNVHNMIEAIDKTKKIEEASQDLKLHAGKFSQQATIYQRNETWKKWRVTAAVAAGVVVIIVIIVLIAI
jgi:Synaptobrevin